MPNIANEIRTFVRLVDRYLFLHCRIAATTDTIAHNAERRIEVPDLHGRLLHLLGEKGDARNRILGVAPMLARRVAATGEDPAPVCAVEAFADGGADGLAPRWADLHASLLGIAARLCPGDTPSRTKPSRRSRRSKDKTDRLIGEALIELKKGGNRSDREIAAVVGLSHSTLGRSVIWQAARRQHVDPAPPRGVRNARSGEIEPVGE